MYRKMYYLLFNAITTAIEEIGNRNYGTAETVLMEAQQEAEEQYLSCGDGGESARAVTDRSAAASCPQPRHCEPDEVKRGNLSVTMPDAARYATSQRHRGKNFHNCAWRRKKGK